MQHCLTRLVALRCTNGSVKETGVRQFCVYTAQRSPHLITAPAGPDVCLRLGDVASAARHQRSECPRNGPSRLLSHYTETSVCRSCVCTAQRSPPLIEPAAELEVFSHVGVGTPEARHQRKDRLRYSPQRVLGHSSMRRLSVSRQTWRPDPQTLPAPRHASIRTRHRAGLTPVQVGIRVRVLPATERHPEGAERPIAVTRTREEAGRVGGSSRQVVSTSMVSFP